MSTPQIMGVINLSPHSFSATGRCLSRDETLYHAERIIQEGADIIDVGGEATNPGVSTSMINSPDALGSGLGSGLGSESGSIISAQEELDRVIPIVEMLAQRFAIPISVDTSKPRIMREAIAHGATMINDVRGLTVPGSLEAIAQTQAAVCLMHMSFPFGKPSAPTPLPQAGEGRKTISTQQAGDESGERMFDDPLGDDPVQKIKNFLQNKVESCISQGISRNRIVIDPGIGHGNFGKSLAQNLQLLNRLSEFKDLGFPLLIGVSRKTFIGELLNLPEQERLFGSLGAAVVAVLHGANIIRVHDVRATVEAVKVAVGIRGLSED